MSKSSQNLSPEVCIGAFDSGVGGLSVLRELFKVLPHKNFVYVADQANVPYGKKTLEQVRGYAENITRFLIGKGAEIIVIPCNTATGAALDYLRKTFPEVPFVGMEPAVKPAAEISKTQKIGILATAGTFQSQRYGNLIERHGQEIEVIENSCLGLVELIESGKINAPETKDFLKKVVNPMLADGIDTIVLGCTHYPFIQPVLEQILPKGINIVDPAPAVARHVKQRTEKLNLFSQEQSEPYRRFFTTGNVKAFKKQIAELLPGTFGEVKGVGF